MNALSLIVDWERINSKYQALTVESHVVIGWPRVPRWDEHGRQWTITDSRFVPKALWPLPDCFLVEVKESLCVRPEPPRFTVDAGTIYDAINGPVAFTHGVLEEDMQVVIDLLNRVAREGRE